MLDERWDPDVEEIAAALGKMLAAQSTSAAVRDAELHHESASPDFAAQIEQFGLDQLEGSPALFARIAMELGRVIAPTAFVETMPVLALCGRRGIAWTSDGLAPASVPLVAFGRPDGLFAEPLAGERRSTAAGDVLIRHSPTDGAERLGDHDLADRVGRFAALTSAARIVGASQALLDYTKAYATEREQFGRPIGSFQAIGHRLANVVSLLDASDLIIRKVAFAAEAENGGDGAPPSHFAIMAWSLAVQAGRFTATNAHQVFGGNGFALEYDVQLYSRRIRSWAMRGPRTGAALAQLGRMVLDPARRDAMKLLWQFDQGIDLPRWAREADAVA